MVREVHRLKTRMVVDGGDGGREGNGDEGGFTEGAYRNDSQAVRDT